MAAQEHPVFFDDEEDDGEDHPIFGDIALGRLGAVQQRVQADAAVLEERESSEFRSTPLMHAIYHEEPAIALWLLQHRGGHDLETADGIGYTALHLASECGPLEVVQALVAAGANPAALIERGVTPLIKASGNRHTDIVAFLLQLPPVKAGIDAIDRDQRTALSAASFQGHQPTVRLLLDADADPTIPAGPRSPLRRAVSNNHHAVAALLRHAINEAKRARECMAWLGKGKEQMFEELCRKVRGFLVHAWADQGPAAVL